MVSVETLTTSVGRLLVVVDGTGLKEIHLRRLPTAHTIRARYGGITEAYGHIVAEVIAQLEEYFRGERLSFCEVPLNPEGTAFLKKVWAELRKIPYGEVRTYGELARKLGTSPRAVGLACRKNPIPIIIPCHRVVAGDLSLYNYSGGVDIKRALLVLEGVKIAQDRIVGR